MTSSTILPTPSTSLHPSPSSASLPPDKTENTYDGGRRLEDVVVYIIIAAVASLTVLIIFIAAITSLLVCVRKRKKEPKVTDNVAYNSYDTEGKTDTITAYYTVNVMTVATKTHTAPETKESVDNEIHMATDITISVNPAYTEVEDNASCECMYDYL